MEQTGQSQEPESQESYSYAREAAPLIAAALHGENLKLLGIERSALEGLNFFDLDGGQLMDAPSDEMTDDLVEQALADLDDESVNVVLDTRGRLRGDIGNLDLRDLYREVLMRIKPGGTLYVLDPFPESEVSEGSIFGQDAVDELVYELERMENGVELNVSLTIPESNTLPVLQMQRVEEYEI